MSARRRHSGGTAFALGALALAVGCAPVSSTRGQATPRTETLNVESSQGVRGLLDMRTEASVRTTTVPVGAATVWSVLPAVFEELGVPTTRVDLDAFVMGTEGYTGRRIGEERVSRYVDCGQVGGRPRADQYQVTLYLMVQLSAIPEVGTAVSTYVDSYASQRGVSGNAVHCVTRGGLERRVVELILDRTGDSGL